MMREVREASGARRGWPQEIDYWEWLEPKLAACRRRLPVVGWVITVVVEAISMVVLTGLSVVTGSHRPPK